MNFLDQMFTESELTMEDNFELEKTKLALNSSSHADVVDVAIRVYKLYLRYRRMNNWLIKQRLLG
jgi:predicted outer membrane protein